MLGQSRAVVQHDELCRAHSPALQLGFRCDGGEFSTGRTCAVMKHDHDGLVRANAGAWQVPRASEQEAVRGPVLTREPRRPGRHGSGAERPTERRPSTEMRMTERRPTATLHGDARREDDAGALTSVCPGSSRLSGRG